MKKLLIVVFMICAIGAKGQSTSTGSRVFNSGYSNFFSAGFEAGVPSNSIYAADLGVAAKCEIYLLPQLNFTGTAGVSTFLYQSTLFTTAKTPSPAWFIPLKVGGKYYFNESAYIEGETGAVIETNYSRQVLFVLSAGPGFIIPMENGDGIDISIRYEKWSNHQLSQPAIRIAYRFGW